MKLSEKLPKLSRFCDLEEQPFRFDDSAFHPQLFTTRFHLRHDLIGRMAALRKYPLESTDIAVSTGRVCKRYDRNHTLFVTLCDDVICVTVAFQRLNCISEDVFGVRLSSC